MIYRVKQIEAFKCITLNDYAVIIGVVPRMSDMGHLHIGFIYSYQRDEADTQKFLVQRVGIAIQRWKAVSLADRVRGEVEEEGD